MLWCPDGSNRTRSGYVDFTEPYRSAGEAAVREGATDPDRSPDRTGGRDFNAARALVVKRLLGMISSCRKRRHSLPAADNRASASGLPTASDGGGHLSWVSEVFVVTT